MVVSTTATPASTLLFTVLSSTASLASLASVPSRACMGGPCFPGNEFCGEPFKNAPIFHLMDQHGCAENDPNGPVFDPVHGVIHHFYQIHLAASPGHGPDYGHFVSKDFVSWAALPVAIWNGLDASTWPPRITPYDNEAIFTGSALVLDGAGPGGKGKGIVQIYPGLCNRHDWPDCKTGTLLAQAVPAQYAHDPLLTNWTKPSYNPIVNNTQRDPSTPWKTPSGEWRMRTYDSMVYGARSDHDILQGKWYTIGKSASLRTCECPSLYELPRPTQTEPSLKAFAAAQATGALPTHVHKTSCGGHDWWQLGTYDAGDAGSVGNFTPAAGWEDLFKQRIVDVGAFYASKDSLYPTKGDEALRRVNWGWAVVPPASTQTLPREITFNAAARTLEQAPLAELRELRTKLAYASQDPLPLSASTPPFVLPVDPADVAHAELEGKFAGAVTYNVTVGLIGGAALTCTISYSSPTKLPVACGKYRDVLTLVPPYETAVSLRLFLDATMVEAYFMQGRVAITAPVKLEQGAAEFVEVEAEGEEEDEDEDEEDEASDDDDDKATRYLVEGAGEDDAKGGATKMVDGASESARRLHTASYGFVHAAAAAKISPPPARLLGGAGAFIALWADSPAGLVTASATLHTLRSIWTTPDAVRSAPRVYGNGAL